MKTPLTENEKLENKIDTMMDHQPVNTDEIIKLVNKIEGTHGDRYLLAVLVAAVNGLQDDLERAVKRINELERVNERIGDSFRSSEYNY